MSTDELLYTGQVEAEYGIKAATLRFWRHNDQGPACFTLGRGRVVYRRSELEKWVAEQERATRRGGAPITTKPRRA